MATVRRRPAPVPPPADLSIHIPLHTDGTVFYFISNEFPGTAMPAFANSLTEEQRWYLVNSCGRSRSRCRCSSGGSREVSARSTFTRDDV